MNLILLMLPLRPVVLSVLSDVLRILFVCFLGAWLSPVITPLWISKMFESEGVPSTRLMLAFVVVVFTICMQAADRISVHMAEANMVFASSLLLYGVAKVAVSRFSPKPNIDPVDRESQEHEQDCKDTAGTT